MKGLKMHKIRKRPKRFGFAFPVHSHCSYFGESEWKFKVKSEYVCNDFRLSLAERKMQNRNFKIKPISRSPTWWKQIRGADKGASFRAPKATKRQEYLIQFEYGILLIDS